MSEKLLAAIAGVIALSAPVVTSAAVVTTVLTPPLVTAPNPGGPDADGTGVWFNPLTGYAEERGFFFPNQLFEDGKYFLYLDSTFTPAAAGIYTQGFFGRGNGVIYTSALNLNVARFAPGDVIGLGVGFQSPGAGFTDLGPTFGNWPTGGRGLIGLTMRDPLGAGLEDIFYGFADITVDPVTFAVTLNGFAYENVRGQSITGFFVPEPATLTALASFGVLALRRRRA